MSKQNVPTFTASKSAGKLYFSLISSIKMPQICSICEKSAYYMAESGVKGALSAVQSGIFGEIRSIIGRHEEKKVLQRGVDSERAEFVAIYGRRRIGKTFLVKQFFESSFDFYTTGVYQVSRSEQLKNWQKQLLKYSKQRRNTPKDWFEAFDQLQEYLQSLKKERFVKNYNGMDENAWSHLPDGKRNAWQGYAYEQVCIHHINQIKKALGISGIASDVCSWTKKGENGAQIDLVIDRSDRVIDLCEIKYCDRPFEIKKDYADWLKERRDIFRENVRTNKTLHLTMITPFGLAKGKYESCVQGCVTAADLFQ
jgi:hypothetical protein